MAILFRISASFALLTVTMLRETSAFDWRRAGSYHHLQQHHLRSSEPCMYVLVRSLQTNLAFPGIRSVGKQCADTRSKHRQKEIQQMEFISLQKQSLWRIRMTSCGRFWLSSILPSILLSLLLYTRLLRWPRRTENTKKNEKRGNKLQWRNIRQSRVHARIRAHTFSNRKQHGFT
jgi:hypothetical protein